MTMMLVISLGFLSRLELSRQLKNYERLYDEMTRLNRESTLLGELGDLLQACLSADEAYALIADRARIIFPDSSGALCMTASSRDLVEVKATWGEPALAERFFSPKDCWGLRRGSAHVLRDPSDPLACPHFGPIRPRWSMCVPMMAHGEALGLLCLDGGTTSRNLPEEPPLQSPDSQQRLARTLAEHAALALANLNLREILRIQSVRDPLTGLYNRRYMEESLERELHRSVRKKSSLGVMMIDIDHFKHFNDTFGHEAGDSVLRVLAKLFRAQLRGEDVACRYGRRGIYHDFAGGHVGRHPPACRAIAGRQLKMRPSNFEGRHLIGSRYRSECPPSPGMATPERSFCGWPMEHCTVPRRKVVTA